LFRRSMDDSDTLGSRNTPRSSVELKDIIMLLS
jgi:hypothetical protein